MRRKDKSRTGNKEERKRGGKEVRRKGSGIRRGKKAERK